MSITIDDIRRALIKRGDVSTLQGILKKCENRSGNINMLVEDILDQTDQYHGRQEDH